MTADNIQYHATFIHSSVYIQDREINVGPGSSFNEKLLEVPIGCCCIGTHASIIITVGLNTTFPNTIDSDLHVGVSDGTNSNLWTIVDRNNYRLHPPCAIWFGSGSRDDDTRVLDPSTTLVPVTTKLTFTPFYKYGSCETAQEGGSINTARFDAQLDALSLSSFKCAGMGQESSTLSSISWWKLSTIAISIAIIHCECKFLCI